MYKYTYKNIEYTYSPENPVILGIDDKTEEMKFGDSLKTVLGMTQKEAEECHATGLLNELRAKRNELLKETDWVAGTDVPQNLKDVWLTYRQELRDITKTFKSLNDKDFKFPDKPKDL
tara:strand:- start:42 stop:395 length:354 start_codon:yes stop_codon:yes gene_type:complete